MMKTNAAHRYSPSPGWTPGRTGAVEGLRLVNPNGQCTIRCYPHDDAQFEADVQMALAESRNLASPRHDLLELVRQRLTQLYPGVAIQPRNPIAAGDDPNELWYCYRDGGLLAPASD